MNCLRRWLWSDGARAVMAWVLLAAEMPCFWLARRPVSHLLAFGSPRVWVPLRNPIDRGGPWVEAISLHDIVGPYPMMPEGPVFDNPAGWKEFDKEAHDCSSRMHAVWKEAAIEIYGSGTFDTLPEDYFAHAMGLRELDSDLIVVADRNQIVAVRRVAEGVRLRQWIRRFFRAHWAGIALSFILLILFDFCRRRVPPDLCWRCRYDLRASPARCPECGLVPSARRQIRSTNLAPRLAEAE